MKNVINVELKNTNGLKRENTTYWWLKRANYSSKGAKLATLIKIASSPFTHCECFVGCNDRLTNL